MRPSSAVFESEAFRTINAVLLGAGVFLLCLFGILTRPGVDVASFWPANAFMLGMLVRVPGLASRLSWLTCALGFGLADLVTGAPLMKAIVLNLGNLTSVGVGYLVLSRFERADQELARPASVLRMLAAITAASLVVGLIGMVADPILFGGQPRAAFLYWSVTELVNYVAFLPMILTLPSDAPRQLKRALRRAPKLSRLAPLFALVAAAIAGALIGGPGAVAFPVLALLWCALSYSLFVTALLSFAFVAWTLLAIWSGQLAVAENFADRDALLSIRVAVSLTGLAPLVVASVMKAREELTQELLFLSNHDQMTGLLNRSAFIADAEGKLARRTSRPIAVLMLDIDHFKSINDTYGHAAGDRVIIACADLLKQNVRKGDSVGRLGGEEFAVLLDGCSESEAREIASRVNAAFAQTSVALDDGRAVKATVSVGLTLSSSGGLIDPLLAQADEALYEAKRRGRNLVRVNYVAA